MSFDPELAAPFGAKIKVIGIGGGGGNAVNTMVRTKLEGVDIVTCNTDVQSLRFSLSPLKIQIGKELTRGLGAGADPDIGRDAALEDRHAIQEALAGADMVFITAGMGGGTGTGGAAVVAQIARELGALTVAVVTKPFIFEGKRRRVHADTGIARLRECVDSLITIPNQRLLQVASPDLSMLDAFKLADDVLVNAVKGISDIINVPGTVNVDFADVKTVMSCTGQALMGIGTAKGEGRAVEAAKLAISSPLLEDIDIEGATGILINITAGANVTLMEVNEACSIIQEAAHEDATIIFGAVIDESLGDMIRVTVIATGFPVEQDDSRDTEPKGFSQSVRRQAATMARRPASSASAVHTEATHPEPRPHAAMESAPAEHSKEPTAPAPSTSFSAPPAFTQPTPAASFDLAVNQPEPVHAPAAMPVVTPEAAAPATSRTGASFDPGAFNEAAELTRMTLTHFTADFDGATADNPSTVLMPLVGGYADRLLDGSGPANEIAHEAAQIGDSSHSTFSREQLGWAALEANRLHGAVSAPAEEAGIPASAPDTAEEEAGAPLESFFGLKTDALTSDIDRRIDEALGLIERAKQSSEELESQEDDLDIPAFLRNPKSGVSLD